MKHIVVVGDRHGGKNTALKRALSLQQQSQAKITLLGFCYVDIHNPQDLEAVKLSRKDLEKHALKQRADELATLLQELTVNPKQVTAKALWSKDISKAICKYSENHSADLLIKSGHRSENWHYTSTDWQLFRHCKTPVMLTAGKSWKKKPRILAAVDLATRQRNKIKLNHSIIQHAQALAQTLNDEVHLVYALNVPQVLADMDLINPREYVKEKQRALAPVLAKLCEQYGLNPENIHIKQGDVGKVVPSIANKVKADVLVCGSMARKGLHAKLMGNSAEAIVQKLHTDIMVVKP